MRKYFFPFFLFFIFFFHFRTFSQFADNPSGEGIDSLIALVNSEKIDSVKINHLVILCWKYQDLGEFSEGLKYGNEALFLSEKTNNKEGMADSHNRIAEIYRLQGNLNLAMENHFAALKISEQANYKNGIARAYKNIGVIYFNQGEYKKSLENYFESEKIYGQIGSISGVGHCHNNIGMVYAIEKNYEEALKYYSSSLKIKETISDKKGIAAAKINIGIIYNELGNTLENDRKKYFSLALDNFFSALKISEEIDYKKGIADVCNSIGNLFADDKKYSEAIKYLHEGLKVSLQIGAKEYVANAFFGLAKATEKSNDFKKAHEFYKQYILYRDSLLNEENTKKTVRLEMQYEFNKKETSIKNEQEKKDALIAAERSREKIMRYSAISFLALMIIIALIIFRSLQITRKQKIQIEEQKLLVDEKNKIVEEKQKEILDSINYAKKIQFALLAHDDLLKNNLPEHFVLFKPKDIVSGDFYWATESKNKFYLAVCDSTGHGIPGAFMSLLNISFLNEAVNEKEIENPNEIFDFIRKRLMDNFSKDGRQDGMDGTLCQWKFENNDCQMKYSAAYNAPVLIRKKNIVPMPFDKMPVGKGIKTDSFKLYYPELQKGDVIYLFTDGYSDQFGGPKGKKFKYSQLEKLLLAIHEKSMSEQKEILSESLDKWRGELEQVDDICVMGVRI